MEKSSYFKLPKEGLYGEASSREFKWFMDEPLEDGGTNLAATPMDHVYAALAGCIAITIRLYARRKNWETGEIDVLVYEGELENGTKVIHKKISFGNKDLTAEQLKRIHKIADVCPVSKVLTRANTIILDED
ncbi:OsmC family peroxiredoxin [Flavobacteriaceae bacterium Ap0902]|nr:OsmC family peroxiredoxin [Flavobacteriaceae bacterium Ap0902]